jgi:hypothetical protein
MMRRSLVRRLNHQNHRCERYRYAWQQPLPLSAFFLKGLASRSIVRLHRWQIYELIGVEYGEGDDGSSFIT